MLPPYLQKRFQSTALLIPWEYNVLQVVSICIKHLPRVLYKKFSQELVSTVKTLQQEPVQCSPLLVGPNLSHTVWPWCKTGTSSGCLPCEYQMCLCLVQFFFTMSTPKLSILNFTIIYVSLLSFVIFSLLTIDNSIVYCFIKATYMFICQMF